MKRIKKYIVETADATQENKLGLEKVFKADYIFERTKTGSYKLIKNRDGDVPNYIYITRTENYKDKKCVQK